MRSLQQGKWPAALVVGASSDLRKPAVLEDGHDPRDGELGFCRAGSLDKCRAQRIAEVARGNGDAVKLQQVRRDHGSTPSGIDAHLRVNPAGSFSRKRACFAKCGPGVRISNRRSSTSTLCPSAVHSWALLTS
jgi:hypothetical protein